jgi:hypothetical protein
MTAPMPEQSASSSNAAAPAQTPRKPTVLPDLALPFAAATAFTALARVESGATLGTIIGGHVAIILLLPPFTFAPSRPRRQLQASAAVIAGVLAVWWTTLDRSNFPIGPMLRVSICTIAFRLNLAMLTIAAERIGLGASAPGCVITIAIAFFTWPIWLAEHISAATAARLATIHPTLIANGLLTSTFPWFEQPIAYRGLTVLNQTIPCALPTNWLACTAVHCGIAAALAIGVMVRPKSLVAEKHDQ